ncbi:MAG: hypothetical protein HY062_03775 [Bacteroidetes bacterium]|nr:hypothetical protein [Bacteroidota bacterium]
MGKLKGKIVKAGDSGMIRYKDDAGNKYEVNYDQPMSQQLGIVEGASITFDLVKAETGPVAVSVNPIEKGEIVEINPAGSTGVILEKESGIKYTFYQNYLTESRFAVGQTVKYTIVNYKGTNVAVCLTALV